MDSLWLNDDDDFLFDSDRSNRRQRSSEADADAEQLYLVRFRWWNEARESLFADSDGIKGVRYAASSSNSSSADMETGDDDRESEILLKLREEDDAYKCDDGGVLETDYALISEWMFLQAFKWYNDMKEVRSILAASDNKQDLFPLHIRLSVLWGTNILVLKITQKDNDFAAFEIARKIFYNESHLPGLWDFSGQIVHFLSNDRIKLSSDSDQPKEEVVVELQVYGLSNSMEVSKRKENGEEVGQSADQSLHTSGSFKMNGGTNHVNSFSRVEDPAQSAWSDEDACILGLRGLYNLGNTCFMNSSLQCLTHTPKIIDYFLGDYAKEINHDNPLGMDGEIAVAFGDLLRKLWAPGATPVAPRLFKSKLARFAPQFSGFNQHDSQELLAFLLDGLHEDLNRVKSKPYVEAKDEDCRPDEEIADEYWQNHLARNDSIIVNVCQGQYRSTLVCPLCRKVSVTFDPFMYLSLPLPSTTMRSMTLTVVRTDGSALPTPFTINVPKYGKFADLTQALGTACSLGHEETLLVAETFNNSIIRFLGEPADSLSLIRDNDRLVAFRLPKDTEKTPLIVFTHQRMEECNTSGKLTPSCTALGIPLIGSCDLTNGSDIRKLYLKLLSPFLKLTKDSTEHENVSNDSCTSEEIIVMEEATSPISSQNADFIDNDESGKHSDVELQFYMTDEKGMTKDSGIAMDEPFRFTDMPAQLRVLVCWPEKMLEQYNFQSLTSLPEVFKPSFFAKQPQESISLYQCLEAFLKEEPLGPEDMWYCPRCKKHCQASKKLDLWRLPEILVIHLKRFSYSRYVKNKLETYVDFPVHNLDLSTHIAHKTDQSSYRYMLYAISNHYGSMGGGHYTAFVHHGGNQWYDFDDSHVSPIAESKIKTSAAYVLFYRRVSSSDS